MKQRMARVDDALKSRHLTEGTMFEIERLGQEAFDYVISRLDSGELSGLEKVNSLRLLGALARHQSAGRRHEVFHWAVRLLEDEEVSVRSAAAHIGILTHKVLLGLRTGADEDGTRLSLLQRSLTSALTRGIDDTYSDFVKDFMRCSAAPG